MDGKWVEAWVKMEKTHSLNCCINLLTLFSSVGVVFFHSPSTAVVSVTHCIQTNEIIININFRCLNNNVPWKNTPNQFSLTFALFLDILPIIYSIFVHTENKNLVNFSLVLFLVNKNGQACFRLHINYKLWFFYCNK